MGRFGAAAILAALCSALCLYGSTGKRRRLQYAARNKLNDTFDPRTMGSWLFFLLGVRGEDLGIADLSGCRRSGRRSFSSISNDSDSIAECVSNKVKYQHDNTYHGVKTLARRLCSIRARSFTSPHIRAPLSLHCLCDSGHAASMGCGQHTSIDLPKSVILRCPGASCCSAQLGATRTLGEPLRQRNCITRGTAHGATYPAASPRGYYLKGNSLLHPERYQHEASRPSRLGCLDSTALPDYGYKIGAASIKEVFSTGFRDPGPVDAATTTLLRRSEARARHSAIVPAAVGFLQAGTQKELSGMSPRAHARCHVGAQDSAR